MTRSRPLPVLTAALAAALALAGCSTAAPAAEPAAPPSLAVDPALRALLPDDVRSAGRLVVATDPSYPPASSYAADGRTIVGFEPDLGAALGELLGVEVEFRAATFDGLVADVRAHRFDAVMSAMTHTPERQRSVDFITYFEAGTSIVVQRGNPFGIHDLGGLCGRTVAVEEGTIQVDLLERSSAAHCTGAPIVVETFPTNDDALLELRTGRAAAVLNDYPPAVYVTSAESTRASYQLVSDVQYEPGRYGIAVAPDRPELRDALAAALAELVDGGRYAAVLAEWDVTSGAVEDVTVNGTPLAP
jgi:polar amino acid transport system substrate-binding protein